MTWLRSHRARAVLDAGRDARDIVELDARRRYLARGLAQVVGTAAAALITDDDFAPGRHGRITAVAGDGEVAPIARAHAERPNEDNPALRGLIGAAHAAPGELVVRVGHAKWRRSAFYAEYFRPAGLGDPIYAARLTGAHAGDGAVMFRGARDRPFDDEDRAVVELFLAGYGDLWHPRATWAAALSPRLRRVLELLLTGLAEKAIAERLGLTPATTHQYVVEVYRRGGVSSRAELMAKTPTI